MRLPLNTRRRPMSARLAFVVATAAIALVTFAESAGLFGGQPEEEVTARIEAEARERKLDVRPEMLFPLDRFEATFPLGYEISIRQTGPGIDPRKARTRFYAREGRGVYINQEGE